jgi:hypothetical protein
VNWDNADCRGALLPDGVVIAPPADREAASGQVLEMEEEV